jgi:threonine/homoserine/homoserine lactone efflux protein
VASVVVEVLPLAVGITASPFPVVPAILLLFTRRPRATAGSFLAGWLVGVGLVCTLAAVLASVVELAEETPTWASWTKLGLGLVLVGLAALQWSKRGAGEDPSWMRALDDATPASALRLGLVLSAANPKIVLLAAAGGLTAGAADLAAGPTAAVLVVFTAVASLAVAVPLLLHVALGGRVLAPLGRARDWLRAHNASVVAAVLLVLGVLLALEGLAGL